MPYLAKHPVRHEQSLCENSASAAAFGVFKRRKVPILLPFRDLGSIPEEKVDRGRFRLRSIEKNPQQALEPGRVEMPADVVNLAMVGLGGWGKYVVRSFWQTAHCRLSYLCDANPQTLAEQVRFYPEALPTDCFESILCDETVDAVALATPAPTHFELAKSALLAGKHVFVEKPMTLSAEHAEELVDLASSCGQKLMVGHLLKYHPAVELMKQQVDRGALGDIYYMYCQRLNLGTVRQDENAFWSLAPHDISVILHLFDAEPVRIEASGQCFLQEGVEDVVFSTLHFADGRVAHIHVSWLDPHKRRSMVLVGSEKMLVFDDTEATEKVRIYDKHACVETDPAGQMPPITVRHGDIVIPRISQREPLAVETEHFIRCILDDLEPASDGNDGLRVVRILEAIDKQFRRRLPVRLQRAA
jgi:predicted dehydrogenase